MKFFLSLLLLSIVSFSYSQSVTLDDIDVDRVSTTAFSLSKDEVVQIKGAGAALEDDWRIIVFYGWIVNTETRKVEWHLFDFMDDNDIDVDGEFDFSDQLKLKKGTYEIYYAACRTDYNRNGNWDWDMTTFNDVVKRVFNSRSSSRFNHNVAEEMFFRVSAPSLQKIKLESLYEALVRDAVVSFNRVEDDDILKRVVE